MRPDFDTPTDIPTPTGPRPEDLVRLHLPLVGHLVRETLARAPGRVSADALHSAGMLALVRAADAFDARHDGVFTPYASARIRSALVDGLRGLDWTAVRPASVETQRPAEGPDPSLRDAVQSLPDRLRPVVEGYFFAGRPMADLADELGITEDEAVRLRSEAVRLLGGALTGAAEAAPAEAGAARPGRASFYASRAAHVGYSAGRALSARTTARRSA